MNQINFKVYTYSLSDFNKTIASDLFYIFRTKVVIPLQ